MKRFIPSLIALALMLCIVPGISAKTLEMSFKNVPGQLNVQQAVTVVYVPGRSAGTRVTVTGPDDKVGNVEVKMSGSTLTVGMTEEAASRNNNGRLVKGVKVTVYTGLITVFDASSAADLECKSPLDYGKADVRISATSAADVEFGRIACGNLDIDCASAADVEIESVRATQVKLDSTSAADIDIDSIEAESLRADAGSGADISVERGAVGSLNADANSGADIDLGSLTARTVAVDHSSGGSVKYGKK